MADALASRRVAFVATEGVEQVELTEPWKAVKRAGAEPVLLSPSEGPIEAWNHFDKGDRFKVDRPIAGARADEFTGLVLPGGVANPDQLRTDDNTVAFVRSFFDRHQPVASICHGPWLLIEADEARDRMMTSWPSLRTDLINAGADWRDEEVVVCTCKPSTLVTSRKPDDLPAFCHAFVKVFAEAADRSASSQS